MNKVSVSRLIRFNRKLSWILVILSFIIIFSGYSSTRGYFLPPSFWLIIREIHIWVKWSFIGFLAFHIFVIEAFIRFKWLNIIRIIWIRKEAYFIWLRLFQKITGFALIIFALLIIISGLNWHIPSISRFIPFYYHLIYDIYFNALIVIHVALGSKMFFIRKKMRGPMIDFSILVISLSAIYLIVALN